TKIPSSPKSATPACKCGAVAEGADAVSWRSEAGPRRGLVCRFCAVSPTGRGRREGSPHGDRDLVQGVEQALFLGAPAFDLQHAQLGGDAAIGGKAYQLVVRADHAMAGHDDRERIAPE